MKNNYIKPSHQFSVYTEKKNEIEGFFTDSSAALFDIFMSFQNTQFIAGDFLEIGVYKGLSALLEALHLGENEVFHLIDSSDYLDDACNLLKPILDERIIAYKQRSELIDTQNSAFKKRSFRWLHIDGEHTGSALYNDLLLCEPLLSNDGILVIDDFFNPTYPQITEATFKFLNVNPYSLSLILCGWNKGYLARPLEARKYLKMIREDLGESLHNRDIHDFMICKTTTTQETSCFGIGYRFKDRDYYGLDANPDDIP
jgi:predicted O-methyltransferase YrrM